MKKLFVGIMAVAALAAFAGTCTIQHARFIKIGTHDTYAGELHNNSGFDILEHNILVAFLDSGNNVLETRTVAPCLRSVPDGGVNFFSATSTFSSTQTDKALARIKFDGTFTLGDQAIGAGDISDVVVIRNGDSLKVTGKFKNTDSKTLVAPNACVVVYDSDGNVILVALDETMSDLDEDEEDTFSVTVTVPDNVGDVDEVSVYVDGFENDVPIKPIKETGNNVTTATATATACSGGTCTPTATATKTNTPVPTNTATATATATP